MGFAAADKSLLRMQGTATFDVIPSGGWIEKDRDQAETEERQERDVKLDRHRIKDENGIAGPKPGLPEEPGRTGARLLQFREGNRSLATAPGVDDGRPIRASSGMGSKDFG
jgi:hypothetical protein